MLQQQLCQRVRYAFGMHVQVCNETLLEVVLAAGLSTASSALLLHCGV